MSMLLIMKGVLVHLSASHTSHYSRDIFMTFDFKRTKYWLITHDVDCVQKVYCLSALSRSVTTPITLETFCMCSLYVLGLKP